jgi:hypothetical protein
MGRERLGEVSLDDAKRLRSLSTALENRGLLLAFDPRIAEQITDMRRELARLRRDNRSADYEPEDACMAHPSFPDLTLCGAATTNKLILVTSHAHRISCASCLRTMASITAASLRLENRDL